MIPRTRLKKYGGGDHWKGDEDSFLERTGSIDLGGFV
jgi:hypothetical protein